MHRRLLLPLAIVSVLPAFAMAQTGYSITGSMSNFDCYNRCDYETDEMEIEIEDLQPTEVIHTYTNGNYGAPTVTLAANGTSTIVDYRNPHHLTAVNSIEHYGVTLRGQGYYQPPATYHRTHVRWYRNGHLATVNGQIPNPQGGTSPTTQPMIPTIVANSTAGSHGQGGTTLSVTNTDPFQKIWVIRRAIVTTSPVTLESLMPNDPVVTQTIPIDTGPVRILPLQTLTLANDFFEVETEQTTVFAARYFQDVVDSDPFVPDAPGNELGNVMTGTISAPQAACAHHPATITSQPQSVTQALNSRVDLRVTARGDDTTPLAYQWFKEGVALVDGNGFSGATTAHLRINSLTAATEGFYNVHVLNTCIDSFSDTALVFITGHNQAAVHSSCVADVDDGSARGIPDGGVTVDDLLFYLSVFERGAPSADVDNGTNTGTPDGGVTIDDLLYFLFRFEAGC